MRRGRWRLVLGWPGRARWVLLVVALVVPMPAGAVAPAGATTPTVTLIGDSVAAGLIGSSALTTITSAYQLTLDAVVCRRLIDPSCTYQGVTPNRVIDVINERAGTLGDIAIVMAGYNDSPSRLPTAIDTIMTAFAAQGVRRVIWPTYRDPIGRYRDSNLALTSATRRWTGLDVADWNAYSAGHPDWFSTDGLHLATTAGKTGLATFLRQSLDRHPIDPGCPAAAPAMAGPALATPPPSTPPSPPPPPSVALGPRAAGAGLYTAAAPQRILDTRIGLGASVVRVPAGGVLTLTVAGAAGVPANATAVAINLTVVDPCGAGFVTAYPCGSARPTASNVNVVAHTPSSNLAVVGVGTGGAVCLSPSVGAQLVVDLQGWFGPSGSRFVAVSPRRVLDTRTGEGGTVRLTAGQEVAFSTGVPVSASAAALNLTVTGASGNGYLTAYPCGTTPPTTSNVNYLAGQTIAGMALVPVGAGGSVCLRSFVGADVIADLAGWFSPAGTGLDPVVPVRLADTRAAGIAGTPAKLLPGQRLVLDVAGIDAAASPTRAAILNLTAVTPTGSGYLRAWPCAAGEPNTSNLNFTAGQVVPNLAAVAADAGGTVCVTTSVPTDVVVDAFGVFGGPPTALRRS